MTSRRSFLPFLFLAITCHALLGVALYFMPKPYLNTPEKTIAIEKIFYITEASVSGNIIHHNAEILLINPDAKIQAYFFYPTQTDKIKKEYFDIVNKKQKTRG